MRGSKQNRIKSSSLVPFFSTRILSTKVSNIENSVQCGISYSI